LGSLGFGARDASDPRAAARWRVAQLMLSTAIAGSLADEM
jgi:hypothetical protein